MINYTQPEAQRRWHPKNRGTGQGSWDYPVINEDLIMNAKVLGGADKITAKKMIKMNIIVLKGTIVLVVDSIHNRYY